MITDSIHPVVGHEAGEGRQDRRFGEHHVLSLAERLALGTTRAALCFGGQGAPCLDELAALERESPGVRAWIDAATGALGDLLGRREFRWSGLYERGFDVSRWVRDEARRPEAAYLASSAISQPLIFITQIATWQALFDEGLAAAVTAGAIPVATGHSQGMMAALVVAESPGGAVRTQRFVEVVRYFAWQGLHMAQSFGGRVRGEGAPMAAISGPTLEELRRTLEAVHRARGQADPVIALHNTRTRHVVSGTAPSLAALRAALEAREAAEGRLRKEGRLGGRPLRVTWEDLAVGAAFHSPHMQAGLDAMRESVRALGFTAGPLHLDVISPATGERLNESPDLVEELLVSQFVRPVRWPATVEGLRGVDHVLDLGPGEGVARLTRSLLRGSGVRVHAVALPSERGALFRPAEEVPAPRYADLAPRRVEAPTPRLENLYTRATGRPPIILAGMTPTTADAGIVAAAANAGFTAELAGGGQVTERVFRLRLEELAERLEPGREVVFNALYLDPWLWDLHVRRAGLVLEARRAGAPICGVTISAGVPDVDEAVALLDTFAAAGLWQNGFKPGTVAQVEQVVRIARAAPSHTIFLHLEGGKAGGHHSFEDLDQLLLDTYHMIREQQNLVLCAGGGIGSEGRGADLLTGEWSRRYGLGPMPVDAVLIGTLAMACAEAATSPQVKAALVAASGTAAWVLRGQVEGGVTSGRSQLDADIHYLESSAARCGRLLDEVAGDAAVVRARRAEIVDALSRTSRPYFGDVAEMTWLGALERMVALMALGRCGRYEDGPWLDRTWRERVADMLRRGEARLGGGVSVLGSLDALDDPQRVLELFVERYPEARTRRVHPADADWFVHSVCARPGKPVPFVPVIDESVRRWFKADSLWASHDDRFDADQVLVIPGPEAVAGIVRADEPVGELLGRFVAAVEGRCEVGEALEAQWPSSVLVEQDARGVTLRGMHEDAGWLPMIGARFSGVLAALLRAPRVFEGRRSVPNPLGELCVCEAGASLRVDADGDTATGLRYHPARPHQGEEVHVVVEGEGVRLTARCGDADLVLALKHVGGAFHVAPEERVEAVRRFYDAALVGAPVEPVGLFDEVVGEGVVEPGKAQGYAALTAAPVGEPPLSLAFSLGWEPLLRVLACSDACPDMLRLVHLDNEVERGGWPVAGQGARIAARVTRVEDTAKGRVISTLAEGGAVVRSRFFVRGDFGRTPWTVRAREPFLATLRVEDRGAWDHLREHEGVTLDGAWEGACELTLRAELDEERPREGAPRFGARGVLQRGDEPVGTIALDVRREAKVHPLRALAQVLGMGDAVVETPRLLLAETEVRAPQDLTGFAECSGDLNPIHRSVLAARLAGLGGPIVHGMWSAARLHSLVVEAVGDARRVTGFAATFLAPALPGEALRLEAHRTGVRGGALRVELVATALRDPEVPVVRAVAWVAPPRTAYVFPGQGVQRQGMGMEAYGRSAAARVVWDRADAHTRGRLGFSILRVVRDNPKELVVDGSSVVHPEGVLHLTQLTQVAMAVMARAQVEELREAGVLVEDAVAAGHSVGEYNALGAIAGVLPVEALVELVYQRGLVMHGLVGRDAAGESGYRMGVVRPHLAGLSQKEVEALVSEVRKGGRFAQIVNYNVRGRQYAVTGHADALAALARALGERTVPGGKPAWVDVPGIDVPFHSELLRAGVGSFREALRRHLPAEVDARRLVGRYVPDLLPLPFALTREFAEALRELTGSDAVVDLLARFDELSPGVLARELLVELLAWQFASPVRWIEVQEALVRPLEQGGLGVERVIEVGPGHQPTLVNMLRSSVRGAAVEVLHAEADLARVLCRDEVEGSGEAVADGPPQTAAGGAPAGPVASVVMPAAPVIVPVAPIAPGGGAPVDRPFTAGDALRFILAAQARVRPEQIADGETIDELFDGVSSRRNQVLLDIGAELSLGTMDGAHERPIGELARELERRARYAAPGRYLRAAEDEAIKKVLGRRAGLLRKDIGAWLEQTWGLGAGLTEAVIAALTLEVREGASARGGALGQLAGAAPEGRGAGLELLDRVASMVGSRLGLPLQRRGEATGGAVDAGAVRELREELLGPGGVLMQTARELASRLGGTVAGGVPEPDESAERLALYEGELGAEYAALVTPAFDRRKHVALSSCWAWARRDVARLALGPALSSEELARETARLAIFGADAEVAATARWYGGRAQGPLADALARIAAGDGAAPYAVTPSRPRLDDTGAPHEVPDEREDALARWVEEVTARGHARAEGPGYSLGTALRAAIQGPLPLAGTTALVTGASPGSIAVEAVGHLLRGGARVVVTTSTYTRDRLLYYRRLYQRAAGPGAELHVVPFNQASRQDADALVAWLFDPVIEQVGATAQVTKRPFAPDLVLPFAALKDLATLDTMGARSEAALRAMLVGVERLVGGIASRYGRDGLLSRRCHVVLPLSPNHGSFGGDGAYAEGKAALEVLAARWQSEHDAWGRAMTLCAARIGWVRGTGLMDQNDAVAEALERVAGIRTFSSQEMGLLVAALCTPEARRAAIEAPLRADLTGGLGAAQGLRELVQGVRAGIEEQLGARRRRADLERREAALLGESAAAPTIIALPEWPPTSRRAPLVPWPTCAARLDETVVIVGMGEVGPWGSSRTRFEVEVMGALSAPGVLELAWVTGLIRYEDHRWVDVESGEEVPEAQIRERYEAEVLGRAGVRLLDPRGAGFDPARLPVLATVYLERDFSFPVGSLDEARSFVDADPEHTRVEQDGGAWRVTRLAGAEVRVPRQVRLSRRVAGAVPDGFDPQRHGIPADMAGSVDRLSLMNLVATVDAFLSAGLTPEELLRHLHPARVANTQGGGIGGMRSLRRLYVDHLLGHERQSDALQETLINVVAAYVVQSYVGSYGPMAHPVGACATAAISLEEARDKILAGKADFVVAGGYDDIGAEGMVGFADMNATASTDDMLAMGLGPDQMSRANDVRRRGFVEAQGGGTLLLARGDVALELGLPVHGVLAWAGSFGDGIHKSIPAPGMGALSAAMGGADSPLGLALRRFGLTADDVALVSKHDTSTGANDPNESALHHRIQAALGRTPGNPLWVVSQKALTGHAKGGAAAWQAIGLCQALAAGVVPGNRNLESVDPAMRRFTHLGFTDSPLCQPLRAGLLTSLGFGHASGMALVLHPDAFEALVPADERPAYRAAAEARRQGERRRVAEALMGTAAYTKRTHRRFAAPDGTDAQAEEEAAMLLNPKARLDPATGLFTVAP